MTVFLHIGLFKTATKMFQQRIFPHMNGINYTARRMYEKDILKDILFSDVITVRKNAEKYREAFESHMKSDMPNVFSHEMLSGNPMFQSLDRFSCLKKMRCIFPDAKIILGLRGQNHMADSMHREYVVQGGTKTFESFTHNKRKMPKSILDYDPHLDLDSLYYGPYLDSIVELFGENNLFVFPYERIRDDLDSLLQDLCAFIGVEYDPSDYTFGITHQSLGDHQLEALRICNRLFRSAFNHRGIVPYKYNPRNLLRKTNKLLYRKKVRAVGISPYLEDNAVIDEKYGLGLKQNYSWAYFEDPK